MQHLGFFWIEFDSQRDQLLGKAYWLITKLFSNLLQFFRCQRVFLISSWYIQSLHSRGDIPQRRNPGFWSGVKGQFAPTEKWSQASDKPWTQPYSLNKFRSDCHNRCLSELSAMVSWDLHMLCNTLTVTLYLCSSGPPTRQRLLICPPGKSYFTTK